MAAGLAAVSLLFGAAALALGYVTGGNAPLVAAALGFCSILTAASSLVYGIFSFLEREKNYILAKASLIAAGILVVLWLAVIFIACKRYIVKEWEAGPAWSRAGRKMEGKMEQQLIRERYELSMARILKFQEEQTVTEPYRDSLRSCSGSSGSAAGSWRQ